MVCPRCKCDKFNVNVVNETETQNRGCLSWLLWIILACFTFGLILIIPLATNTKTTNKIRHVAVCQRCGYTWYVKPAPPRQ